MFASRSELVQSHIQNSKTDFVLLDRYYHASIAYQGFGRGISRSLIDNLINAINAPKPDLTFIRYQSRGGVCKKTKSSNGQNRILRFNVF